MKLINAWIFSTINIISGFILLPLILNKFSSAEINVWFLFFSIVGMSEMVVFGFNITFSRFVSYTYAGTHYLDFQNIKNNSHRHSLIDKQQQLSELFTINIIAFFIIAFVYFVIIQIFGYFSLRKPISFLENPSSGWIAWYILVGAHFVRILCYTFPIFIQGMNKMDKYYNIQSIQKIFYMIVGFLVLYYAPALVNMSFAIGISIILSSILFYIYFLRYRDSIKLTRFNKTMFIVIWDSAWKSGITKIIAPIVQYFSGILFAQVANPELSSSFLFSQRIFNLLQKFADVSFNTYLPRFARLRSQNNLEKVKSLIVKVTALSYGIIVMGYAVVIIVGPKLLKIIDSKTDFAPPLILILFSFAYLMNRFGGFQLNLANQANNVIEHKAVLIYSILYFGILFLFIKNLQMWIFPAAMIIAQIFTLRFILKRSYKLYNTTFFNAEKYSFIPSILVLIIINLTFLFIIYN